MNVAPSHATATDMLQPSDTFPRRHIGPDPAQTAAMLQTLGLESLDQLTDQTIPAAIRLDHPLNLPGASHTRGEHELLAELKRIASQNKVYKSFIGMGYYGTITPPVILRNILENPGWYTQYTPYQAEISQGRLEALLNFQTMVSDLTALPLANASLLDEATAAAEAMSMCYALRGGEPGVEGHRDTFFISDNCHPQTIAVVQARAHALGIKTVVGDESLIGHDSIGLPLQPKQLCGVLLQYPGTDGRIEDYGDLVQMLHDEDIMVVAATDLLALTLIKPPGEWGGGGADIAVGSAQRFGVPMGFGGPHAAFMATKSEYARKMPGRLVGVSKDAAGNPALRLALQTREQHIRREKATSNICTAQALLANIASMYAVYHGPEGLKAIALRVHGLTRLLASCLTSLGHEIEGSSFFDTLKVRLSRNFNSVQVIGILHNRAISVRTFPDGSIGFSLDETTSYDNVMSLLQSLIRPVSSVLEMGHGYTDFAGSGPLPQSVPDEMLRTSPFLQHPVFNKYHSEHEMLRYIKRLESRDLSLTTSNIPLGSCTMKLNGTSEMLPITWPEFADLHPFAPEDQTQGYQHLFKDLEAWLSEITGFAACSLQPNAGSQGEYAGLLVIRAYHEAGATGLRSSQTRAGSESAAPKSPRTICLIPTSAHGTNPASAVIAGLQVVPVACDEHGNIDLADLRQKAAEHAKDLACIMVTYPSTHGVFEEGIVELCQIVHQYGGQVYMDGANMNAQVGLTSPGFIGADVCHLNLHKTFCIPHGGGGPGMGPICVAQHLAPFLPVHPLAQASGLKTQDFAVGPISAAPYGSAAILPISWVYIALMGPAGLKRATQTAILNANYMAKRLESHYPILFRGQNGRVAHEFILDCRQFEQSANIKVEDIAKRLMDYGFHAPTMSWPVPGTLMFEPTESESREELDRLCDAMILIRAEIRAIEEGRSDRSDNALKHAPHTAHAIAGDNWNHSYSREHAAFPAPWTKPGPAGGGHKFWPYVGRIDNPYGDRNLVCTCPPVDAEST